MSARPLGRIALVLLGALGAVGCADPGPAKTGQDMAAPGPPRGSYQGMLDIELRNHLQVSIVPRDGGALTVSLNLVDGDFRLFAAGTPLTAQGRAEPFPEADLLLYTALLASPPRVDGPCKAQPISLAFSLSRRGNNSRVSGSLSAYCGANRYSGIPARILRISGDLAKIP